MISYNRAVVTFCLLHLTTFRFRIINEFHAPVKNNLKKRDRLKRERQSARLLPKCRNNSENGCSFHGRRDGGRQRSCFLASAQFRQFTSFSRPIKGTYTHTLWNRAKEGRKEGEGKENDKSLSAIWGKLAAIRLLFSPSSFLLSPAKHLHFLLRVPTWFLSLTGRGKPDATFSFYIAVCFTSGL